jgi:hypothetical protein
MQVHELHKIKVDDRDLESLVKSLRAAGKEANLTDKQIDQLEREVKNLGTRGPRNVNKLNASLDRTNNLASRGANLMLAYFSVEAATRFISKTIQVRSEFEKLQAVLNNTLGSKSVGKAAFDRIQEFASKTPFAVTQVTNAFVKLAGVGFIPTNRELEKLSDLALSTGKNLNDMVEALLDAMVGENERLKEFNIRAKRSGEDVIYTYKGIETQVKLTDESVRDYILSLGDLEGVSGVTAEVSKTMGGQISNAGDAVDRFFNALGNDKAGIINWFIAKFTDLTNAVSEFIDVANSNPFEDYISRNVNEEIERFNKLVKEDQRDAVNTAAQEVQRWRMELEKLQKFHEMALDGDIKKAIEEYGISYETAEKILRNYNDELELTQSNVKIAERVYKEFFKLYNTETKNATQTTEDFNEALDKIDIPEKLGDWHSYVEKFKRAFNKAFGKDFAPDLEDGLEAANKKFKKHMDTLYEDLQEGLDKQGDAREQADFENRTLAQAGHDFTNGLIRASIVNDRESMDMRMDMFRAQREEELRLVGDNEAAKARINKEFDAKEKKLREQQAEREKNMALFQMLISEGPAIAKTASTLGFPLAIPFVAAMVGLFAAQSGKLKGVGLPRFKDGVFDLDGPGSETSDSIPAMLSKRESVVPAKRSKEFSWLLQPLIEDKAFNATRLRQLVEEHVPMQLRGDLMTTQKAGGADPAILEEMRRTRKAIENMPEPHWNVDNDGLSLSVRRGETWTHYVNNRYSSR